MIYRAIPKDKSKDRLGDIINYFWYQLIRGQNQIKGFKSMFSVISELLAYTIGRSFYIFTSI